MDLGQSCLQAGRARSNTMQESTDGMFVQSLRTQESSGLDKCELSWDEEARCMPLLRGSCRMSTAVYTQASS